MHNRNVFLNMTKTRCLFFIIFFVMTVLWAGVIFDFSASEGKQSVKQSNGFVEMIYNLIAANKTESIDVNQEKSVSKNEITLPAKTPDDVINNAEKEKGEGSEIKGEEKTQMTQKEQGNVVNEKSEQKTEETETSQKPEKEPAKERKPYVLNKNTNVLTEAEQQREERVKISTEKNKNIPMFSALDSVVRKFAHISAYALLAFLAYFAVGFVSAFPKRNASIPWISATLCILFACTDEYHQSFVNGRSGRLSDVVVDGFGVFAGTLVAFWLAQGFARIKKK